ncbi:MAG: endonuclease III [Gemmatimonadales bacterium]|jgi:endonuclease-3
MPNAGDKNKKKRRTTPRRPGKAKAKPARAPKAGRPKAAGTARPTAHAKLPPASERIGPIIARLAERYPEARCSLDHVDPLQLLVATILSAQCTDVRVNLVTKTLFQTYRSAGDYAAADPAVFEEEIKSTGFFRNKTKSVLGMAAALVERFGGKVPDTMDDLVTLPGVGRKTANVVLGNAFGKDEGVVVDTHVARIGALLGLTRESDPVKIEQDLMALVPRSQWTLFPHLLIHHGRAVCIARRPRCGECPVADLCPSAAV